MNLEILNSENKAEKVKSTRDLLNSYLDKFNAIKNWEARSAEELAEDLDLVRNEIDKAAEEWFIATKDIEEELKIGKEALLKKAEADKDFRSKIIDVLGMSLEEEGEDLELLIGSMNMILGLRDKIQEDWAYQIKNDPFEEWRKNTARLHGLPPDATVDDIRQSFKKK